jgi:HPt (histidine-containing phosphotransfer) domain-containing protein
MQTNDLALVGEIAHWIRGSAGTVGFAAFTQPAAELERAVDRAQPESIEDLVVRLEAIYQQLPMSPPVASRGK